ncbi:hypothetical protein [Aestuariivivens sediminicola]|uniref:hypothetical protein n=1 Tax=Aestuariivivens sediminicola TaxID=2913560 RepID=UPI001F59142A|nr:hypothetical protein [Aestuariivivens sediminicola]
MKKILYLFLFFGLLNFSNAQIGKGSEVEKPITVGVVNKLSGFPHLVYYPKEDKNYYFLNFQNNEYPNITDIKSVDFYATPEELDYLYDFLMSCFEDKELHTIDVGDQTLVVKKTAMSIRITVDFNEEPEPSGWTYLSKRQLQRLFGKK